MLALAVFEGPATLAIEERLGGCEIVIGDGEEGLHTRPARRNFRVGSKAIDDLPRPRREVAGRWTAASVKVDAAESVAIVELAEHNPDTIAAVSIRPLFCFVSGRPSCWVSRRSLSPRLWDRTGLSSSSACLLPRLLACRLFPLLPLLAIRPIGDLLIDRLWAHDRTLLVKARLTKRIKFGHHCLVSNEELDSFLRRGCSPFAALSPGAALHVLRPRCGDPRHDGFDKVPFFESGESVGFLLWFGRRGRCRNCVLSRRSPTRADRPVTACSQAGAGRWGSNVGRTGPRARRRKSRCRRASST